MIRAKICDEPGVWDEIIHDIGGHPMQLWGWGELKVAHGWQAQRLLFTDDDDSVVGAAQLLARQLPWPLGRLYYVPRGPVWREGKGSLVIEALGDYAKQNLSGVLLSIEPDVEELPTAGGWQRSSNTILIPQTLILDLSLTDDELMSAMSKKTRQYVRKSGNEDIVIRRVRSAEELQACLEVYHQTAERAGFAIHGDQYYRDVAEKLGDSSLLMAAFHRENPSRPIAFVWLAISAGTAFELYGGMDDRGQELRANYALKWQTIQKCKEWGIERYDMNGLLSDGISTFKRGFADHENLLAGTYDLPLSWLYPVWAHLLPVAKKAIRLVKK